ncbi:vacuolar calcium transmembrane transporter [Schizosaccharomyces pombe]|uniref:Putative cation exchanger C521.04c n=1 Tax=Schizosaccharomyces pombe (strain 972 / ATCC 24843) TaxID=284812 RepID=YI14_SCHPO|nr:putative calcium permease [Schizosaccharomyces pombe]Q9P7B3.1 RecName: Full=Putative cation exchanger C521.04c [Schizosaccharomyces pombe 972h-]CAB86468.1 calcium permease (predicted) [Schizosaccharomyces pombe]|eukprot:NP_593099.1 putative calcium permease [Schizosaccharomyces pombe]
MSQPADINQSESSAETITQGRRADRPEETPSSSVYEQNLRFGDFLMPTVGDADATDSLSQSTNDRDIYSPREIDQYTRKVSSRTDPSTSTISNARQHPRNSVSRLSRSSSNVRQQRDIPKQNFKVRPLSPLRGQSPASLRSEESFTLKERQNAINKTRAFGMRLWKPALYKKFRSINRDADIDIHDEPLKRPNTSISNVIWLICFGAPLFLVIFICYIFFTVLSFFNVPDAIVYSKLCRGLMFYLLYPFGQHVRHKVKRLSVRSPAHPIYQTQHSHYDETPTSHHPDPARLNFLSFSFCVNPMNQSLDCNTTPHRRNASSIIYTLMYYLIIAPTLLITSAICMFTIFFVPCARTLWAICRHLRTCPLSLSFRPNLALPLSMDSSDVVLLCVKKAASWKYYKYTIDGIYIIYFDMLALIIPTIFFGFFGSQGHWFTSSVFLFTASLVSIIPLAYFIGMAVASISAQSSMGMGAFINAFFGSVIEVFLYSVALRKGNAGLVEGSVIGSILAGLLLMPGLSMCAGAIRKKFQFFNIKSAGATSTMLLFAVLGAFAPTMLFRIYGPFRLDCEPCGANCQKCTKHYVLENDSLYKNRVLPFTYCCSIMLVLAYAIGLWFTLRTHASHIWQNFTADDISFLKAEEEVGEPVNQDTAGNMSDSSEGGEAVVNGNSQHHHNRDDASSGLSSNGSENESLEHEPTNELPQRPLVNQSQNSHGDDAPNWSRSKSAIILLSATFLYSLIAEILVEHVDTVLDKFAISEKFLGLTLFALVPNTTEFMNAISFALNENIALSMEIGSAYALQVCLLQIPCLMGYSLFQYYRSGDSISFKHLFTMVFPTWDMICVMICVFLLTYVHSEGKSNYFKGSILVLAYLVSMLGFTFFNY